MMFLSLSLSLTFLCISQAISYNATTGAPKTVDSLDVSKYLGKWYQMASNQIAILATNQKDTYCSTALYGDNGDQTISVHNYCAKKSPSGEAYTIDGFAYQTNKDKEPGQLNVKFTGANAPPLAAPYWILELGPVNDKNQYDYSIVSDSTGLFLFVLARDVQTYLNKYKAPLAETLKQYGFTGLKAPVETVQGGDCVYESDRRMALIKAEQSL